MIDPIRLLFSPQVMIPLIYPGLVFSIVVIVVLIWAERKIAGKVQLRYGPLYVSKHIGGFLQLIADAIRYIFQEPIIPKGVDRDPYLHLPLAYILTPIATLLFSLLPIVVIPVAPNYVAIPVSYSLPLALAFGSLTPVFVIVMGWASNNKFTLIGGVREALMVVSYEVALFISGMAMAFYYGTLDLQSIVLAQRSGLLGLLVNPFAAFVFFVASMMSAGRIPFDISEGEQEIVAGPFTEYSGIMYALVMGSGYIRRYVSLMLFSILFLGGWYPLPPEWLLDISPLFGTVSLVLKTLALLLFCVFLRSVYGRYRLDHAMEIGWRKLVPLSVLSVILSIVLRVVA